MRNIPSCLVRILALVSMCQLVQGEVTSSDSVKSANQTDSDRGRWVDPVKDTPTGTQYKTFFSSTIQGEVIPLSKTNGYNVHGRSVCLSVKPPVANQTPSIGRFLPVRSYGFGDFLFDGIQAAEYPITDFILHHVP
jgi:hypothetical protein